MMRSGALVLFGLVACTLSRPIGDGLDTDSTSASSADGEGSQSDAGSSVSTSADETGDAPTGPYVDCAAQNWGPLVGGGDLNALGWPPPCNPRTSGEANGYRCCSTDPATADGQLPAYEGTNIIGSNPLYADAANDAGTWGHCVNVDDLPPGSALQAAAAEGCPLPCDPTWTTEQVEAVCGESWSCCQTVELGPKDCVQEETGLWRPVTGSDIGEANISPITVWAPISHDTHQDPNGTVCTAVADCSGADCGASDLFRECIRHLGVANRRGFCMAVPSCPGVEPAYVDACEAMNG